MAIVKRIGKDGSVSYQVRNKDPNGQWYPTATFKNKADSKILDTQQKHDKHGGLSSAGNNHKTTLDEFWKQWLESSNKSTEGWKSSQRQMYRDYVQPHIGSIQISKIKPVHVSDLLLKVQRMGRSAQTVRHVYGLLRKLFGDCINHYKYIRENPVSPEFNPKVTQVESEFLYYQETLKLLKHVRGKPYGLGISIQLVLSIRSGEVKYLKWEHIDFYLGEIRIYGTYRKKENRMVDIPKDGEPAKIKIPKLLLAYLTEEKARNRSEWVQPSENDPSLPFGEATYGKYLKKYCEEAGVNSKITSHCLRHSTHSIVMAAGGTEEDMQNLLRHASPATTKRYLHGGHKPKSRLDGIMSGLDLPMD